MTFFTKREQIGILVLVIIIISIVGYNVIIKEKITISSSNRSNKIEIELEGNPVEIDQHAINEEADEKEENIMVYICGQVRNPGVAVISKGTRLIDALKQVGGLIEDKADKERINLSKKLYDEEKIYIPAIGEEIPEDLKDDVTEEFYSGKININSASKDILMQLPGIGEVIAQRIIEYRKVHRFKSIEELTNVSGIGDTKFEAIKDLIIVN